MNGARNHSRDGFMTVNGNGGSEVNYEPNSVNGLKEEKKYAEKSFVVKGEAKRRQFSHDDDFVQPRALWEKVFKEENREYLVNAMAGNM
jgi:catalase